jgi:hypothetical protein
MVRSSTPTRVLGSMESVEAAVISFPAFHCLSHLATPVSLSQTSSVTLHDSHCLATLRHHSGSSGFGVVFGAQWHDHDVGGQRVTDALLVDVLAADQECIRHDLPCSITDWSEPQPE